MMFSGSAATGSGYESIARYGSSGFNTIVSKRGQTAPVGANRGNNKRVSSPN